jgi:hypothetical protein
VVNRQERDLFGRVRRDRLAHVSRCELQRTAPSMLGSGDCGLDRGSDSELE